MEYAIEVLRHAESVLVKKLKAMKDGKPKYAASNKISELRDAISLIEQYESGLDEFEDAGLVEALMENPPHAKA